MTPKEKAQELRDFFESKIYSAHDDDDLNYRAKECAIYCVDEIIELLKDDFGDRQWQANEMLGDWKKVREEIEKL